ncbi:aminoglycoside phosphotransferase family protein [Candidatus Uhrbacteria bacterium]|nr:aminoglycoside phosphotransferase family protein [Candidatus Uhrbacteria bacterium]
MHHKMKSILNKLSLKSALRSLYGLKNPVVIKRLESGYKAESFVIQDGDNKFFIKKYHPKRLPERLLEIHRVKKFFSEHGVSTIPPLANSQGTTLSEADGAFFSVFPYVPDKQYYALPNEKAVASAGENLGGKGVRSLFEFMVYFGVCHDLSAPMLET